MDKHLNEQQQVLLTLLETKMFSELNSRDKELVINEMTREEYELQGRLISESTNLYEDAEPKPLVLQEEKKGLLIPIPLYQAIASIAATLVVSYFIFSSGPERLNEVEPITFASTDTVYIEKQIIDTLVEYRTKYVNRYINVQSEPDQVVQSIASDHSSAGFLNTTIPDLPELKELDLVNLGSSMASDETLFLIEGFDASN
ncbi:MAG: hypothetical protein JKY09_07640 [Crocinitomicaceae bacterium]|nr:hypothetical protein [Crocinitomicaceae bacterium]